jgi:hypothetical protein
VRHSRAAPRVPVGVEVVDAAALARGAGLAGVEAPLLCAGLALDSDCAGFGAAEPPPLDPLEGELDDAAGFGALELPELEPLSEDDFAAAGFGAGELPPEPPEAPPATLATVRTATVEDTNPGVVTEEVVLAFVDKSSVPNIHTSATAPRSTDTDPARHSRTNTQPAPEPESLATQSAPGPGARRTRAAHQPRPPTSSRMLRGFYRHRDGQLPGPRSAERPRGREGERARSSAAAHGDSTRGFRGSQAPSSSRIADRGHVTRRPAPSAEHSGTSALAPATTHRAHHKATAASSRRNRTSGNQPTSWAHSAGAPLYPGWPTPLCHRDCCSTAARGHGGAAPAGSAGRRVDRGGQPTAATTRRPLPRGHRPVAIATGVPELVRGRSVATARRVRGRRWPCRSRHGRSRRGSTGGRVPARA